MKTSLDPLFMPLRGGNAALRSEISLKNSWGRMRHAVGKVDFNTAYDFFRTLAVERMEQGMALQAMQTIAETDALIVRAGGEDGHLLNVHAALMQILTALRIEQGQTLEAMESAAQALNLLAQEPKRKDEPFLQVLAMLLYDISLIHSDQSQFKQAEREVEKSAKIFERLVRLDAERYGSAHLLSLNAVTAIYRDRQKQAKLLSSYQASTSEYLELAAKGMNDAALRLVDSLAAEAKTLSHMGRYREAVQFYIRTLKYLTKIEPDFTERQLELSIEMGQCMLQVSAMREKGIHLLNTMLHKATRLSRTDLYALVSRILSDAQSHKLDILGVWHKMFPR